MAPGRSVDDCRLRKHGQFPAPPMSIDPRADLARAIDHPKNWALTAIADGRGIFSRRCLQVSIAGGWGLRSAAVEGRAGPPCDLSRFFSMHARGRLETLSTCCSCGVCRRTPRVDLAVAL